MGWLGRLDIPARVEGRLSRWLTAVLIGLGLAAAAQLLRELVGLVWPSVVPSGFIFPAILLATLFGRWLAGLTAFVAGGLLVWLFVVPPLEGRLGENSDIAVLLLYGFTGAVMLGTAEAYRSAERRLARERSTHAEAEAQRQRMLTRELNHRMKNTIATVQAIAAQTIGRAGVDEAAFRAFGERLAALGRAHDLLTQVSWSGVTVERLAKVALAPFEDGRRFRIEGPRLMLPPTHAVALSLALHELATNALKYGALSVPDGRVEARWTAENGEMRFCWAERDGPAVAKPTRSGFGTRLLERGVAAEFGGNVSVSFAPEGLRCEIVAPLTPLARPPRSARSRPLATPGHRNAGAAPKKAPLRD